MCHPEVPAGEPTPSVYREEVTVPLRGAEAMPALLTRPDGGRLTRAVQGGSARFTSDGHGERAQRSGRTDVPAVLIVHDIFGRSPFYENLAARLSTAGFVALLPDYFFRQGPLAERSLPLAFARRAKLDEPRVLQDLDAALDHLRHQPGVRGARIGTVGFCMGGTLVLNLAARHHDLATVCYYGFVVKEAHATQHSAPAPLDEVERISGPIIGFWGDQDHAALNGLPAFAAALLQRGVAFEHTIYPGLGHGFMAQSGLDPNHPAYQMACESWTRALDFLRGQFTNP